VYLAVTIPSLRTVVTPAEVDTRDDRIEAMRILSAGNTIMMVILGAILILQVSFDCHMALLALRGVNYLSHHATPSFPPESYLCRTGGTS
jgi:hypothetical protein